MKIKLKWIFFLLYLCSCVGNRESEKNNNIDADAVAEAVLVLDSISAQNIVEVVLDSISADEELIKSDVYMVSTSRSYPFDRNYTLRPFRLFKNVDPNCPDTPDSIASLLASLKAEIHKDTLVLTNGKTGASCEIHMSFDEPFEWNSENEKHYYFYYDKLNKYGSYMGGSVLRVFAENDIEECSHYSIIPRTIYVYDKYIIMKYLNMEINCSLWFFNPWYEEKCKILARSKDSIDSQNNAIENYFDRELKLPLSNYSSMPVVASFSDTIVNNFLNSDSLDHNISSSPEFFNRYFTMPLRWKVCGSPETFIFKQKIDLIGVVPLHSDFYCFILKSEDLESLKFDLWCMSKGKNIVSDHLCVYYGYKRFPKEGSDIEYEVVKSEILANKRILWVHNDRGLITKKELELGPDGHFLQISSTTEGEYEY